MSARAPDAKREATERRTEHKTENKYYVHATARNISHRSVTEYKSAKQTHGQTAQKHFLCKYCMLRVFFALVCVFSITHSNDTACLISCCWVVSALNPRAVALKHEPLCILCHMNETHTLVNRASTIQLFVCFSDDRK